MASRRRSPRLAEPENKRAPPPKARTDANPAPKVSTRTSAKLDADLFNTYRTVAPTMLVTWSFVNVLPLLQAQFGGQTVDWVAAVVLPADAEQITAAADAGSQVLWVAVTNWAVDAILRKLIFWHKPIPWDFVVHHVVSVTLCTAVHFLHSYYGFMYLALLSESYAVIVFAGQLSFVKPKTANADGFERIKSVAMHVLGLATLFLVRTPIWLFILHQLITRHMREAGEWTLCVLGVCCAVVVALQYLDYIWSIYHIGELLRGRNDATRGIEAC